MAQNDDPSLVDYLFDELSEEAAGAFERSLEQDTELAVDVASLEETLGAMRNLEPEDPPEWLSSKVLAEARQVAEGRRAEASQGTLWGWLRRVIWSPLGGLAGAGALAVMFVVGVAPRMQSSSSPRTAVRSEPAVEAPAENVEDAFEPKLAPESAVVAGARARGEELRAVVPRPQKAASALAPAKARRRTRERVRRASPTRPELAREEIRGVSAAPERSGSGGAPTPSAAIGARRDRSAQALARSARVAKSNSSVSKKKVKYFDYESNAVPGDVDDASRSSGASTPFDMPSANRDEEASEWARLEMILNSARHELAVGDISKARRILALALKEYSDSPGRGEIYLLQAEVELAAGQFDDAARRSRLAMSVPGFNPGRRASALLARIRRSRKTADAGRESD